MSANAIFRARARAQLDYQIFSKKWLMAVFAVLIVVAINAAANRIAPGIAGILLSGPFGFGLAYLFLKQSRDGMDMNLGDLFNGFTWDFGNTLLIGLMTMLFTALWSFLFMIPGIVKAYGWSMAYFIKADCPNYDWHRCMRASEVLMQGHKMELFLLDLSFIGWMIVGSMVFGIGTLWVSVYMFAARAQFYNNLIAQTAQQYTNQYEY